MAHYAFIDDTNTVVEVIVGRDEWETVDGITDWEAYYASKRDGLRCLRTSYNTVAGQHVTNGTPYRGNYAGIGYIYDETLDAFIPPQPYPSWGLNEETFSWEAPVPYPEDGGMYVWQEDHQEWTAVENETE